MNHSAQREHPSPIGRGPLVAITLLCVTTPVVLARALGVGLVDDSYIFLRYARNIAEGNGPVFNIGDRVEGYSSPLWTFTLAAAGLIVPDLERAAVVLGLCCGAGVVALLVHSTYTSLCRRDRPGSGAFHQVRTVSAQVDVIGSKSKSVGHIELLILGLAVAAAPPLVFWSASGMEAALFLLLVTASLLSVLKDRGRAGLSAGTASLLVLTTLARPEGALLAAYTGAFFMYERRSIRALVGYVVAIGLLLLARYAYYGSWLPNTYHAKVTFDLLRRLRDGVAYILPALRAYGVLLALLAVMLAVRRRSRDNAQAPTLFLGGWVVLWCCYVLYVGGDNFALFRFLLPVTPGLFLLFLEGWSRVRVDLTQRARSACLAGLLMACGVGHVLAYRNQAASYFGDVALARSWAKVGRWLERNTPPHTVVATIVPGALGYFSRRPMIDMLGLTDRTVALHGDVFAPAAHGHARYNTDYIFERQPDIVLYHSSGRFTAPRYVDPGCIPRRHGYALHDFVNDPRCARRYAYESVRLDDGTWIELQRKRRTTTGPLVLMRR